MATADDDRDDGPELLPLDDEQPVEECWDAETTALLTRLFTEEAREHLEVMSRAAMVLARDAEGMAEILRRAHTLKGAASTVGFAAISEAAHLLEERCVQLRSGVEGPPGEALAEWMMEAVEALQRLVDQPELSPALLGECRRVLATRPGEPRSRDRGQLSVRASERVADGQRPSDRRAASDRRSTDRRQDDGAPSIRVDVDRVEELMNAVGQLVVERTSIERQVFRLRDLARDLALSHRALRGAVVELGRPQGQPALERVGEVEVEVADTLASLEGSLESLVEDSDRLGRTSRVLRDHLTRVRMMPISLVYARLQRTAHRVARAEGKRVELTTTGESTEMDRSVVEKITDPLLHLVRNAVAHGIETPGRRRAAGKPPVGLLRISARHQGDMLFLDVEDDGAGIDAELLRAAAARLGLAVGGEEVDPVELIFTSGFSTRATADGVAGRGVGLDVVRQNISSLSGDVRVSSSPGTGTRFSIRLPMTTAINQALLFKQGGQVYAVPVVYVVATHVPQAAELLPPGSSVGWQVRLRGVPVPLIWLDRLLGGVPAEGGAKLTAVIEVAFGERRFALGCTERLVGPREIVLKRLGPLLGAVPLFAGATISGAGKVQLVLDVATLGEIARRGSDVQLVARGTAAHSAGLVLVADDSRSIREVVALTLGQAGYDVELAADGWEAWQKLQGAQRRFDLLLTDLEMPRLDGIDLIARCRGAAEAELAGLPILVLTSRTAAETLAKATAAGADRCLKKPVNRRAVLEQVRAMISAARS